MPSSHQGFLVTRPPAIGTFLPAGRVGLSMPGMLLSPGASPILSPVGPQFAQLLTSGRILRARQMAEGLCFTIPLFAVGTGGYYPQNPTQAIPVNPGATGLQNEVLRKAPVAWEFPISNAISIYCRIDPLEAPYGLGELLLIAQIQYSPFHPLEVGSYVPFALSNFPIMCHSTLGPGAQVFAWRTTVAVG